MVYSVESDNDNTLSLNVLQECDHTVNVQETQSQDDIRLYVRDA